jgi:hypothetical protein
MPVRRKAISVCHLYLTGDAVRAAAQAAQAGAAAAHVADPAAAPAAGEADPDAAAAPPAEAFTAGNYPVWVIVDRYTPDENGTDVLVDARQGAFIVVTQDYTAD